MCSSANAGLIQDVCREKVTAGELFTAFDISLEVQRRAKTLFVPSERHRDMKDTIHETMETYATHNGGEYSRTLMDVGAPEKAFVYHHITNDPANYKALDRSQFDRPALTPTVPSQTTPDGAFHVDARGTLCALADDLRHIGAMPGMKIVAVAGNGKVKLYTETFAQTLTFSKDEPQTEYTVDKYGNVRITQYTLRQANIGGVLYSFEHNDSSITILPWVVQSTTPIQQAVADAVADRSPSPIQADALADGTNG